MGYTHAARRGSVRQLTSGSMGQPIHPTPRPELECSVRSASTHPCLVNVNFSRIANEFAVAILQLDHRRPAGSLATRSCLPLLLKSLVAPQILCCCLFFTRICPLFQPTACSLGPAPEAHTALQNGFIASQVEAFDDIAGHFLRREAQLDKRLGDGLASDLIDDLLQLLDRCGEEMGCVLGLALRAHDILDFSQATAVAQTGDDKLALELPACQRSRVSGHVTEFFIVHSLGLG